MSYPKIIQGGMGVAVSSWQLARAVSREGQLGVVSGTALDLVLTRRLQLGDEGGDVRLALKSFPVPEVAERILAQFFVEGGKREDAPFKSKPLPSATPTKNQLDLIVVANFVEVWLAKHGHDGLVGINLLEKIQVPTLPSLFGAMLAGVDYVLMGAGIPKAIPGVLDALSELKPVSLPLDVTGALPGENFEATFDPAPYVGAAMTLLKRPSFLAIVSSAQLATMMARKCSGKVNGFVIEGSTAGGHNAPPRGAMTLDDAGEPIYGPRDVADLAAFRELGLPFWLAGSFGRKGGLKDALAEGAEGVQVGTAFAFCEESGMSEVYRQAVVDSSQKGQVHLFTDPHASPTGYPFKVLESSGSMSERDQYASRERLCDLGYLRELYRKENGQIGYRCPAEPVEDYVRKGGDAANTDGRKCLCNGLSSTIGLGQVRKDGYVEPALVTAGDRVQTVAEFLRPNSTSFSAKDVVEQLLEC